MRQFLIFISLFFALAANSQQTQRLVVCGSDTIAGWMWNDKRDSVVFSKNTKIIYSNSRATIHHFSRGPNEDGRIFFPVNATFYSDSGVGSIATHIYLNQKKHYQQTVSDTSVLRIRYCDNGIDTCEFFYMIGNPRLVDFPDDDYSVMTAEIRGAEPYKPTFCLYFNKDQANSIRQKILFTNTINSIKPELRKEEKQKREDVEKRFSVVYSDSLGYNRPVIESNRLQTVNAKLYNIQDRNEIIFYNSIKTYDTTQIWVHGYLVTFFKSTTYKTNLQGDTLSVEIHNFSENDHVLIDYKTGEKEELQRYQYPFPNIIGYAYVEPTKIKAYPAKSHWFRIPIHQRFASSNGSLPVSLLHLISFSSEGKLLNFEETIFDELYAIDDLPLFTLRIENGIITSIDVAEKYEITKEWIGKRDHDLLWLIGKKIVIDYHEYVKDEDSWIEVKSIHEEEITDGLQILKPIKADYLTIGIMESH